MTGERAAQSGGRANAGPSVAVFRPDDDRLATAVDFLAAAGADPLPDPMLAVHPTGRLPRTDAAYTILTSKTGAELLAGTDWTPGGDLVAIGPSTADALQAAGFSVDHVPETYTSAGLVEALADRVAGERVEVARSDHGSAVLLDGLEAAGAYCHETVLYELTRPDGAGESTAAVAAGEVDGLLFTSSLTVEHFAEAARERGNWDAVQSTLPDVVVGAIGPPTKETAEDAGIAVDVVPDEADFEALADAVLDHLATE